MLRFSNSQIGIAVPEDVPVITALLNSAYRGETSRQGWTTEAGLIAGDTRTNESEVASLMNPPESVFVKYTDESIIGCVNLQQRQNKIYLGMLSVSPGLQGSGVGKKLLGAAEEYAAYYNCPIIYMTVISVREELINWYKRHGYADLGQRKPFEEDAVSGKHLRKLDFMVLEKRLQ